MSFLRVYLASTFVLAAPLVVAEVLRAEPPPGPLPNVIIIYTDDQGSVDAGCYGTKDIETPNIDALAARGVVFTQFYSAAPVCSPSRAALLTGRCPQRAGLEGNASSRKGVAGMPAEQVTIAEILRGHGYATGHVGKWHLGYTPETMPGGQGFDHSFGHMGGCIDNYSHFFYWNGPNRHDLHRNGEEVYEPGKFFPDLMVREAVEFMEANRERAFFLYFALNVPHYPYQGDEKWLLRYRSLPYPRNLYAAFLSTMDERIGRLLAAIDRLELRKKTIIVLQSDHGHSTEQRAHGGGGSAGPFRGAKFSLFEGGIRVPAIISWSGTLAEGETRDQLATACDWLPTILELCGLSLPAHVLDGKSLVPVLRSPIAPSPHAEFHWQSGGQWAVRSGRWKLLWNPRDTASTEPVSVDERKFFLADLSRDPGESRNLSESEPDIVNRLSRLHESWVQGLKEPSPRTK